jgi:hypothetical protein
MYKNLLSVAAVAAAVFGLSQPILAGEAPDRTMSQNEVSQANVEPGQVNTVRVKGVVLNIFGESYAPVVTGHDALMGQRRVGTRNLVRIRTEDGREQTFTIAPKAQAAAGIAKGSDVELVLYSGQLVAISGPSGSYQIAEITAVETISQASTTEVSKSVAPESTASIETTTIVEEQVTQPAPQPVPEPVPPVRALW